jgi:hypothetical protein
LSKSAAGSFPELPAAETFYCFAFSAALNAADYLIKLGVILARDLQQASFGRVIIEITEIFGCDYTIKLRNAG